MNDEKENKADVGEITQTASGDGRTDYEPAENDPLGPFKTGGCPLCCRWDDYLPTGVILWSVCHRHRTKAMLHECDIGWGVTQEEATRNAALLSTFKEVVPAQPRMSPTRAATLLRLADAVSQEQREPLSPEAERARREQLEFDAARVRLWVKLDGHAWAQPIYLEPGENPLVKGADQR